MNLNVRTVEYVRNEDNQIIKVNVRFDGFGTDNSAQVNGFISITSDEYFPIAADIEAVGTLAQQKLSAQLA